MKIKAINSIIQFDGGQMVVINPGETGELSEAIANQQIAAGNAEPVREKGKGKGAKTVDEPAPAGEEPADEDGAPV